MEKDGLPRREQDAWSVCQPQGPDPHVPHGVSFAEAQSVFYDEHAIRSFDPNHSQSEDRFIMLGMSFLFRVLVVCHCYHADYSVIRIVSTHRANAAEARAYTARGGDR